MNEIPRTVRFPGTGSLAALCALAVFALLVPAGFAKENAVELPEEVDRILKDMSGYLRSIEEFTFQADVLFDEVFPSGQVIQHGAELKAAVHRPDKLAARFLGDRRSRTVWLDGSTFTILSPDVGVYTETKVPAKIDAALDHLMEKFDVSMPLADFVSEDVYGSLTANIERASYIGKAVVDGRSCDHIACTQELIDWQLWVEDGIRRLPRKIVIHYKAAPGVPVYIAQFSEWDLGARLPALLFKPNLPLDAVKIDLLEVSK